jgi:hypothetical protein
MNGRKFSVKQGFIVREIAGEFLAVPVDFSCGANIVVLNPVSKFLWEELKEEKSFDELIKAILSNYTVTESEAKEDLKEFLMQMLESDLLN